jgi:hypothetical protein
MPAVAALPGVQSASATTVLPLGNDSWNTLVLLEHETVLECAVVAAPDERWGEIPVAFVVLKPGQKLSQEELCTFLQERIAKFKMPRAVEFVEGALPKTGTGKIVKRELREKFWAADRAIEVATINGETGLCIRDGDRLTVATGGGHLRLLEIQAEGKRPMNAREFLAGHRLAVGERFTPAP